MRARVDKAFAEMAAEIDRREQECLTTDKLLTAGLPIGDAARRQHEQWVREGKPLWRETPAVVARVRKAAKRAAKNARGKGKRR